MRLASVYLGGNETVNVAFKEWCEYFGHTCTVERFPNPGDLLKYDGVFFGSCPEWEMVKPLKNYSVMLHTEFDQHNRYVLDNANAISVIDSDYWGFSDLYNLVEWYPCVRPRHLLTGREVFLNDGRIGTLYAARLSTWKNGIMLKAFSNLEAFREIYGPILVTGVANNPCYGGVFDDMFGVLAHNNFKFDNIDMDCRRYTSKYFWDVSGNLKYITKIPRLNLSCFEAMSRGCIPIVNMDFAPKYAKDFCIDYEKLFDEHDTEAMQKSMLDGALDGPYGFESVSKNVCDLIALTLEG